MLDEIISYIRSWLPTSANEGRTSRKRRAFGSPEYTSPSKHRKVLSPVSMNLDNTEDTFGLRNLSVRRPLAASRLHSIIFDNDSLKTPQMRNKAYPADPDPRLDRDITSFTERRLDAKKSGYEYVTSFTRSPVNGSGAPVNGSGGVIKSVHTTKQNGTTREQLRRPARISPILKNSPKVTSSPIMDYTIRLEDKQRYRELLDNIASSSTLQTSPNHSSLYGTPTGKLFGKFNVSDRTRKILSLSKSPRQMPVEVVDLTEDSRRATKTNMSTRDTVMKPTVISDSDSDVEFLPTPPSPKPDIKVEPVNSLKTVIDTSNATKTKWLDNVNENYESYVKNKRKEIDVYGENATALAEINHDIRIKLLSRRVHDSLAIKGTILPVKEEEEETEFPELTAEDMRIYKRAMTGDPNEILTKKFNLNVNRRDMQTLSGLNWLNDNVINFYMNLIIERGTGEKWPKAYAMNTFFYPKLVSGGPETLRRWTRKVDLFSCHFICVPVHLGMHWCMAIINLEERSIKYYDSMGKSNNTCLRALSEYLEYEHKDKKGKPFSTKDFILENVQDIPQQMNGSDCGMFACTFAEFATRKSRFNFEQEDMPYLRKKMVVEIMTGQFLIQ